ncbi:hypothetical protein M885DRAFT_18412 [Pelagophyceae sp. CCMP2097]|nr:hypothetical protein M885DRAFT_18412 [Pelagophyceae sp. CCMP2097]
MLPRRLLRGSAAVRRLSSVGVPNVGGAVPTVDVGGLATGASPSRRKDALKQLHAALLGEGAPGFFYASSTVAELDDGFVKGAYDFSRSMHSLPLSTKRAFSKNGGSGLSGVHYNGLDVGVSEPSYDGVSKSTASAWDYSRVAASRLQNGWDSALPSGTVASFDSLYLKQDVCGAAVLRAVAEVLALPLDTFEAPPGSDLGTIRLISYPGRPAEQDGWTMANSNSGDHHWTYTDEEEEEANVGIVIIGDVLERYTNGLLKATPHRVLPMEHPRQSIIRFHAVAPDALVQPLPQFITPENPAAYTPVTMEHHMNTTLGNLDAGVASWDSGNNASKSATYHYNTPS